MAINGRKWDGQSKCENKTLINRWTDGQRAEFRRSLGYRLVLIEGAYPEKAKSGSEIEINLKVKNEGWAGPFNQRIVYLALRSAANPADEFSFKLMDLDPRQWPGQTTMSLATRIKIDVPAGAYDLYLYLPDSILNRDFCANGVCDSADYAIRLANLNLWEVLEGKATGYNNLKYRLVVE